MSEASQTAPATEAPAAPTDAGGAQGSPVQGSGTQPARAPGPGWGELVSAALLGTERRTPPGGSVTALLDAAAVETVRHRAGLLPARAGARAEPAPEDSRPPLPTAAAQRLTTLLGARSGGSGSGAGRRGPAPDLAELLPQWLATANEFGYRAPAAQLPALLDAARSRTDLRPETMRFAGPRGLWLARFNPEWKFALRNTVPEAAAPERTGTMPSDQAQEEGAGGEDAAVQRLWQEGLFAERVALLTSLRRRDPSAGIALLTSTWSSERAEDRLMFLDSLREGLCPSDEAFLDQALSDRSRTVRATAAELLSNLPSSALAARMASRARTCVTLGPARERVARIAVEAPHECDAAMQRDGVVTKPPTGRGERAWWLTQLVEATPLAAWHDQFGGRSAEEIAALPVADGWEQDLHTAWCRAAVRQRDAEWARALIGAPAAPLAEGRSDPARSWPYSPKRNGPSGRPDSSRRTGSRRRSMCSRCAPCHGTSRWDVPWSTPWRSPETRAVIRGGSAV